MTNRLVRLDDGLLVEVEVAANDVEPISGGLARRVSATIDAIQPIVDQVCRSFADGCRHLPGATGFERAEVEFGLGFELEGNLYLTRSRGSANIVVRVAISPQR